MRLRDPKGPGVYVVFLDRKKRLRSRHMTLEGCTPEAAFRLIHRLLRESQQRKAS